ncbi:hypothetical protein Raf01_34730 [Rugosimonospora africana]|uniref:Uncharacterized protein n=1 Tax=Rugosimonospora africana TaxID=556532 RepID=A0A8J3QRQ8_9ACTN|nr:hypothetical protein Raf01_34730 [Rugosimonospora africana]
MPHATPHNGNEACADPDGDLALPRATSDALERLGAGWPLPGEGQGENLVQLCRTARRSGTSVHIHRSSVPVGSDSSKDAEASKISEAPGRPPHRWIAQSIDRTLLPVRQRISPDHKRQALATIHIVLECFRKSSGNCCQTMRARLILSASTEFDNCR